jgi:hypothetical protein
MNSLRMGLAALSGIVLAAASGAPAAYGQAPATAAPSAANPWVQGAAFPDASEEVLGAAAGGTPRITSLSQPTTTRSMLSAASPFPSPARRAGTR